MTLKEFFKIAEDPKRHNYRAWVNVRGFNGLYLRYGKRIIDGKTRHPVLDLASLEASKPGNGAFTRLVARLRKMRPNMHLYVESVLSTRFGGGLLKRGFTMREDSSPICPDYYMLVNDG